MAINLQQVSTKESSAVIFAQVNQPTPVLKLKFPVLFPLTLSSLRTTGLHLHNSAVSKKVLDYTIQYVVRFSSFGYYPSVMCLREHCTGCTELCLDCYLHRDKSENTRKQIKYQGLQELLIA